MRYAWAAYKKGSFLILGEPFADTELNAHEFRVAFLAEVTTRYHSAWTLLADSSKGFVPVGFVFGIWPHADPRYAPYMIVGDMVWMPWASSRNKIESAVQFFERGRGGIPMMEYARPADKKFFDVLEMHKVMRRIGTSFNIYPNEPAAVFETRNK